MRLEVGIDTLSHFQRLQQRSIVNVELKRSAAGLILRCDEAGVWIYGLNGAAGPGCTLCRRRFRRAPIRRRANAGARA